jgi:hypothetical protein
MQFLIFTEVAATATVVGSIALLAAIAIGPSELRGRLLRTLPLITAGYALAIAIISPLLLAALLHPNPINDRIRPDLYPLDLKNLVVPTVTTWVGGARFQADSLQFAGNLTEQLAYLGPLLIFAALGGIWRWRHERFVWVIVATTVTAIVLSFGAHLTISGDVYWSMPWQVFAHLPLIQLALPTRIVVYAWLGLALLGALFVTRRRGDRLPWYAARLGLLVLALIRKPVAA